MKIDDCIVICFSHLFRLIDKRRLKEREDWWLGWVAL